MKVRKTFIIGSLDFVATFNGVVYLFADDASMQKFIRNPSKYIEPNLMLSQLKICIPGPTANGPSVFAQTVAKVFGLKLVNIDVLLTNLFQSDSTDSVVERLKKSGIYQQVNFNLISRLFHD